MLWDCSCLAASSLDGQRVCHSWSMIPHIISYMRYHLCSVYSSPFVNITAGIPSTAIREVSLLQQLRHPNIVQLIDVIHTEKRLALVFEYVQRDLQQCIDACGREGLEPFTVKVSAVCNICLCSHYSVSLFDCTNSCSFSGISPANPCSVIAVASPTNRSRSCFKCCKAWRFVTATASCTVI